MRTPWLRGGGRFQPGGRRRLLRSDFGLYREQDRTASSRPVWVAQGTVGGNHEANPSPPQGFTRTGLILACILAFHPADLRAQGREEPERRFEFRVELRSRAETRLGSGAAPERADGFPTSRLRFDFTARPEPGLKIYLQAQDSRVAGLAASRDRQDFRNGLDFHQAFLAIGREDGPATLHAGRQELDVLDSRLLGRRARSNVSPSWDGSKLTLRRGENSAHLVAFSQVDIRDGSTFRIGRGSWLGRSDRSGPGPMGNRSSRSTW